MNVKPTNKYKPSSLVIETKTALNPNIISNHFNKFFTQIAGEIEKKIEKIDKRPQGYLQKPNENSCFFQVQPAKMMLKILYKSRKQMRHVDLIAFQEVYLRHSKKNFQNHLAI